MTSQRGRRSPARANVDSKGDTFYPANTGYAYDWAGTWPGGSGTDAIPPLLLRPVDAANGATASTATVETGEADGTLYVVVTTSAVAPTAAQVKLGQDDSSVAATFDANQAVSTLGVQTIAPAPSGLTTATAYTTHFMHEDSDANQSAVVSAAGFTTA